MPSRAPSNRRDRKNSGDRLRNQSLSVSDMWFATRGWTAHPFQLETWRRIRAGESGLVHVPTGSGKTYAAYLGFLDEFVSASKPPEGLALVYVTPLRAVSRDIELALRAPVDELGLAVTVGARTGDSVSITMPWYIW